jgi:hypothetical protein
VAARKLLGAVLSFLETRKPCDCITFMSCIKSALRLPSTRVEVGRLRAQGGTGRSVEAPSHPLSGAHNTTSLSLHDHIFLPRLILIESEERSHEQLRRDMTVRPVVSIPSSATPLGNLSLSSIPRSGASLWMRRYGPLLVLRREVIHRTTSSDLHTFAEYNCLAR